MVGCLFEEGDGVLVLKGVMSCFKGVVSCFKGVRSCSYSVANLLDEVGWGGYPADSGVEKRFELINAIPSFEWRPWNLCSGVAPLESPLVSLLRPPISNILEIILSGPLSCT